VLDRPITVRPRARCWKPIEPRDSHCQRSRICPTRNRVLWPKP